MNIFNVPADFKLDSLAKIDDLNKNWGIPVKEVYGSISSSIFGSGRKDNKIPNVENDALKEYIKACNLKGILFNYTFNLNSFGNQEFTKTGQKIILDYVSNLIQIGIKEFTITLPSFIALLEKYFPEIPISVSVISSVDSIKKASYYSEFKNVKCIYLHESINRSPSLLKVMVEFIHNKGIEVGTIVNSFCLYDCPIRNTHYDYNSHMTSDSNYIISEYYMSICSMLKFSNPSNILSIPWIRPEDLDFYISCGIDRFKITGRERIENGADFNRVVNAYNQRKWDGDLVDLFLCFSRNTYTGAITLQNNERLSAFIEPILSSKINCSPRQCSICKHCDSYADLVKIDKDAKEERFKKYKNNLNTYISRKF